METKLLTKADFPRVKQMHESGMEYKDIAEALAKEGYTSRSGTPVKLDRISKFMRSQRYFCRNAPEGIRKNNYVDSKTRRKLARQQKNPQMPLPFMNAPQEEIQAAPIVKKATTTPPTVSMENALREIGVLANSDLPQDLKMKYIAQLTQAKG